MTVIGNLKLIYIGQKKKEDRERERDFDDIRPMLFRYNIFKETEIKTKSDLLYIYIYLPFTRGDFYTESLLGKTFLKKKARKR